jgi:ribose transport system ATP-binding protein
LSIAEQQTVEIAKALIFNTRILVMDEPTAALDDAETERLFQLVRQLRDDGVARWCLSRIACPRSSAMRLNS